MQFGSRNNGWGAEFILDAGDSRRLQEQGSCEAPRGLTERSRAVVVRTAAMAEALAEVDGDLNLTVYLPADEELPVTITGTRILDTAGWDRRARELYLGSSESITVREAYVPRADDETFLHQNDSEV